MEQRHFNDIIKDYDFACEIVERYENTRTFTELCGIFDMLGYNVYNEYNNEIFDMEIGNLILTYSVELGGIDKTIQVWYDDDWYDTDIDDFKNNLGLAMLSHTIYKNNFHKDHNTTDEAVCFDEFLQNEWKDEEIKDYYITQLKEKSNENN